MDEQQLNVFIDGTLRYFEQITTNPARVGTPFLIEQVSGHRREYTGIIGISGRNKGLVYFSASKQILVHLLASIGEADVSDDNLLDLVGEIANTISGNARKDFGSEFMISAPFLLQGDKEHIKISSGLTSYAIPIHWRNHEANLVISLE